MALLMLAGPLIASVVGLCVGGSRTAAGVTAVLGSAAALVMAALLFAQQPWDQPLVNHGLTSSYQVMPFSTFVDGLAATVSLMVCAVSLVVQVYSVSYMHDHPRYASYAAFLSLFTAAMLMVVVAGDLLFLVVGWEVMGLCSYLLISQHWERRDARHAAMKAFLVTKFGDVAFILGIIVLIGATDSLFLEDAVSAGAQDPDIALAVSVLLLIGVLAKSAQFPLHGWLPDAMAGPSPVSALIHAATMVAAGVYVVARMYPLFLASPTTLWAMGAVACITMLGGAVAAFVQEDLKRVLAWSTVSQLGYMFASLAVGSSSAAAFHLLSHAFFKALLFLCGGIILHITGTSLLRDLRNSHRLRPGVTAIFAVGLLALVGLPPLSGFFSKESVLAAASHAAAGDAGSSRSLGWFVLVTAVVTVAVTAAYAFRAWMMLTAPASDDAGSRIGSPRSMQWSVLVLVVPIFALGFLGLDADWLPTWLRTFTAFRLAAPERFSLELATTVTSLAAIAIATAFTWLAGSRRTDKDASIVIGRSRTLLAEGFEFSGVYRVLAVQPFEASARAVDRLDRRVISRTVRALGTATTAMGGVIQLAQRGDSQRYLSAAVVATVVAVVVAIVSAVT